MMVSAELRWFWKDEPPRAIEDWFHGGGIPAGGGRKLRRDCYFPHRGEPELGVKTRDEGGGNEQVEIKGLVAIRPPRGLDLDVRRIEIWCKWSTSVRPAGPALLVEKMRWLRKFADGVEEIPLMEDEQPEQRRTLSGAGCNVELTKVVLPEQGDLWWTLGFEAFGGLDRVYRLLAQTLRTRPPPCANPEAELSYPAWLKTYYGW
jgi:hypothetical protein